MDDAGRTAVEIPGGPGWPLAPVRPARGRARRALLRVLLVLVLAAFGLLTLLIVATDTGPGGLVVGALLAVVPVFPVAGFFLWLDRYEAEPPSLLLFALAWGAFVATFIALVLNTSSTELIRASGGNPGAAAVFVAPVVEETAKGLAVVAILLFRRREFDGVVDGIVYAGMSGIGFAFVENILYLGRSFSDDGSSATAVTFVVRCLFSPFAHPLFTSATGIGLGLAVSARSLVVRVLAPVAGFAVAVFLHGAWNASASSGLQGFFTVYVGFQLPIFALFVVIALVARAREGRLLRRHLAAYAGSGWITESEARMLGSLSERSRARDWAGRTLGPTAKRAMRDFQDDASELAFLRERMSRGRAAPQAQDAELLLLRSMWQLRQQFVPPSLPRS